MIILEQKELLEAFWLFLDRPVHKNEENEDSGLDTLLASYFAKTITVFLTKQPAEMIEFIESKPSNLDKILNHLYSSAIMDLLLTLVRMEELSEGKGIVQWLSDGGLLENLIDRLDPYLDTEEHSIAQQCICEIIRMSQTSLLDQPSIGVNDLIIKLKSEPVMRKLAGFMLDAKAPNATSTLINGVTIIIDLIRHNNSDMENDPMLATTYGYGNNPVIRQTSVSLADMLKVLADHVADFNQLLIEPRSVAGPIKTSIGEQMPLGFERLKICELFAELLHCSNMSNLNAPEDDHDEIMEEEDDDDDENEEQMEGNVQLEGQPINNDNNNNTNNTTNNNNNDNNNNDNNNNVLEDNNNNNNKESVNDNVNNINISTSSNIETNTTSITPLNSEQQQENQNESTINNDNNNNKVDDKNNQDEKIDTSIVPDNEPTKQDLPMGDYLKLQLVQYKVLPTCTDLFFSFPWNNFLHYVTYDMLHQVFNGRMDKGYNRLLALSILKDGQLTTKMVNAQKENDQEWSKPKGMRLGYMGHLTFIADEVIKLFEGYPEAIVQEIKGDVDLDIWYHYCETELRETKERDCLPLGGDRPNEDDAGLRDEDEDEDDDDMDGATASQYSRYLAQREADGGLEDDEEDAHWITGRNDNIYGNAFGVMNDGHNEISNIDEDAEYDSDEDEHGDRLINQDWSRGFTEFSQPNMLRRTQSHIEDEYDPDEQNEYNESQQNPPPSTTTTTNENHIETKNDNNEDDDPFGDFASSEDVGHFDDDGDDDDAWGIKNNMNQLNINDNNNKENQNNEKSSLSSTTKENGFGKDNNNFGDHYVPAIRTKEEDEKYKKEYLSHQDDDEQEGEI
ncbi:unnamed protein product [Cunninghamella blakesleeana]